MTRRTFTPAGARLSVMYLFLQAALTAAWWVLLLLSPAVRAPFKPGTAPDEPLLAFWLADLTCVAGGSALAAWWLWRRDRRASAALWFTSGSVVYAALYCAALVAMTGQAILAAGLMLPAAVVTVVIAMRSSMP